MSAIKAVIERGKTFLGELVSRGDAPSVALSVVPLPTNKQRKKPNRTVTATQAKAVRRLAEAGLPPEVWTEIAKSKDNSVAERFVTYFTRSSGFTEIGFMASRPFKVIVSAGKVGRMFRKIKETFAGEKVVGERHADITPSIRDSNYTCATDAFRLGEYDVRVVTITEEGVTFAQCLDYTNRHGGILVGPRALGYIFFYYEKYLPLLHWIAVLDKEEKLKKHAGGIPHIPIVFRKKDTFHSMFFLATTQRAVIENNCFLLIIPRRKMRKK